MRLMMVGIKDKRQAIREAQAKRLFAVSGSVLSWDKLPYEHIREGWRERADAVLLELGQLGAVLVDEARCEGRIVMYPLAAGLEGVHKADLWCSYCAGQQFKVIPDPEHSTDSRYTTWECVECGAQFDDNPGYGYFTSFWGDKNTSDTPMKYNPNTGRLVT